MAKSKDIIHQMEQNPQGDWRIAQLIKAAENEGIEVRKPSSGSHYTFNSPYFERILTVPFKRPIKGVYVKRLCRLVADHRAAVEEIQND